jgi:hypothetical protein
LFADDVPQEGASSLTGLLSMFRPKSTLADLGNVV